MNSSNCQHTSMNEATDYLSTIIKNPMGSMKVEELVIEAVRDLIKEEIKRHIVQALDEDPELKEAIRESITELMAAKLREAYALIKMGKCGAELGIALVPEDLRKNIDRDLAALLEKQVSQLVDRIE
jgi:hypothetical protein